MLNGLILTATVMNSPYTALGLTETGAPCPSQLDGQLTVINTSITTIIHRPLQAGVFGYTLLEFYRFKSGYTPKFFIERIMLQ
jgi:hypothetical protein